MVFANNIVRAVLSVCSLVAIRQAVVGHTMLSRDPGAMENRQSEA